MNKTILKNKIKISALAAICFVVLSSLSLSAKPYGAAGCGMGSVIFEGNNGTWAQLGAVITDAYLSYMFYGQVSSIAAGTSNCGGGKDDANTHLQFRQEEFVALNHAELKSEMAAGSGEKLESFAALLGCSSSKMFAEHAQKRHSYLFNKKAIAKPVEFVNRVKTSIKTDKNLATSCNLAVS